MSDTLRCLLLALWSLLTGCAPPPTAPAADTGGLQSAPAGPSGWVADPGAPGTAWLWGDGQLRLHVAADDEGPRTRGVWIEREGRPLASPLPSSQLAPLLIATPRSDGTPPLRRLDGDRIVLALAGSAEHGCPRDSLEVAVDVDPEDGSLTLLASGVPYLLLDAVPVLVVRDAATPAAVLPGPGSDWTSDAVQRLAGRTGGQAVGVEFRSPPPWMQLQRHGQALELDLDHSCEDPSFDAGFLAIRVPA